MTRRKCFDRISHERLLDKIGIDIGIPRLVGLIKSAVTAGVIDHSDIKTTKFEDIKPNVLGTPQGSVLSPTLCNVYLSQLDEFIDNLNLEGRFAEMIAYIRYADDFIAR